jgi:hypothetical protein
VILRVAGAVLIAAAAVEAAVIESFLVPLRVGTWPLPICVPLAIAGNVVFARLMAQSTGSGPTALIPGVLWLGVVLIFAAPRAEGDLIVPGTATGTAMLFLGALAAAFGAGSAILPGRRRTGASAERG